MHPRPSHFIPPSPSPSPSHHQQVVPIPTLTTPYFEFLPFAPIPLNSLPLAASLLFFPTGTLPLNSPPSHYLIFHLLLPPSHSSSSSNFPSIHSFPPTPHPFIPSHSSDHSENPIKTPPTRFITSTTLHTLDNPSQTRRSPFSVPSPQLYLSSSPLVASSSWLVYLPSLCFSFPPPLIISPPVPLLSFLAHLKPTLSESSLIPSALFSLPI
ncbi:hypothetical protein CVT24_007426 [Panaeolus cyanescens]|uniref:Uncharacterized protein n=1 Tax=Panaeolus cyanescens TaxID=181874 RepID=A0A409YKZ3_9AGAR|nr:hypothetical protein CVT24_007426 [Panaeolus cyanescens]